MVRSDLSAADAKTLVESDGNVVHWSRDYFGMMRLSADTVLHSSISDENAMQTSFSIARYVLRHFRTGTIDLEEAELIFRRQSRHIGSSGGLSCEDVDSKEDIRMHCKSIAHTNQDDHR
jgi:hypothetical protein